DPTGDVEHLDAEEPEGENRLADTPFDDDETGEHHHTDDSESEDRQRRPGILRAAPGGHQDQCGSAGGEEECPEPLSAVGEAPRLCLQDGRSHEERYGGDRHVDVEDPAPGHVVSEESPY